MQLDVEVSPPASVITLNKYKRCVPKEHWLTFVHCCVLTYNFFLVPDFFPSEFWSSPRRANRQANRKRLLRAHHALAQVGSIMRTSRTESQ